MLTKFPFRAGIIKDDPPLSSEEYWGDGSNVRFYRGRPEIIRGWTKYIETPLTGKIRKLANWSDLDGNIYLAAGTSRKLYVVTAETLYNVTPYDEESTGVAVTIATTSGSPTVTITDTSHGRVLNDTVSFSNQSAAVGGVTLSGEYTVIEIVDSSNYKVTYGNNASGTATTGVTIDLKYELNVGEDFGTTAAGYGAGTWGSSTWGTERTTSFSIFPRTWCLEGFGEYLLGVPYGETLYVWAGNPSNRAVVEAAAPDRIDFMFTTPERFVIACGTHDYGTDTYSPLLVRWASQETYDTWTPTSTNTAGEYPLGIGNRIIGGLASKLQNLIWTDTAMYAMRYLGDNEFVFGFDLIGTNCGLISPNAMAHHDGVAFWMSTQGQFFMYDGGAPRNIPCPVRNYVFDRLNWSQTRTIHCGLDTEYNEVVWFYASEDSDEIDSCVAYNFDDDVWWIGAIPRTAWLDRSLFQFAVSGGEDGDLYRQNSGQAADEDPIVAFIETAPFDVGDGDVTINISKIIPDMETTGDVTVTLTTMRWPNDVDEQVKVLSFGPTTTRIDTRAQGRIAKIKFSTNSTTTYWRLGDIRLDIAPVGKR
jgi:hypothetical protein